MAQTDNLKKRIDALIAAKKRRDSPPIDMIIAADYKLTVTRLGQKLVYEPTPTMIKFHKDKSLVRALMGPYGSGKSVGCDSELMFWGADMPNCLDGIKRCRFIITRNTYPDLQNTTVKTWLEWYGKVGEVKYTQKPPYFLQKIHFQRKSSEGEIIEEGNIEMELIFLSLDSYDDLHKLDSIECTGFYINEWRHTVWRLISHMVGRIDRYPKASDLPDGVTYKTGIIGDTNPPPEKSDFYQAFEVDKPENYRLFKQPPALIQDEKGDWIENPERENKKGVKAQYYLNQISGATREFIKVHIEGKYGTLEEGKAVYNNYNDDIHSVDKIEVDPTVPLLLGWDFGLSPACIILQITQEGYVNCIKELASSDLFLDSFIPNALMPVLQRDFKDYYGNIEITSSEIDPSGINRDQVSGWSPMTRMAEFGLKPCPASTNNPFIRIDAVKKLLETMINGHPRFRISRQGCPILREGFLGRYQYKKLKVSGEEIYSDQPDKNDFSHPHDALQYACLKIVTQTQKSTQPINNTQWYRTTGGW